MPETWPLSDHNDGLQGTYREKPEDNVAEFPPEVGDVIARRRTSSAADIITFDAYYTRADYQTLKAWRRDTLKDGILKFTRNHPFTGVSMTGRFMRDGFNFVGDNGKYVRVTLSMRVE